MEGWSRHTATRAGPVWTRPQPQWAWSRAEAPGQGWGGDRMLTEAADLPQAQAEVQRTVVGRSVGTGEGRPHTLRAGPESTPASPLPLVRGSGYGGQGQGSGLNHKASVGTTRFASGTSFMTGRRKRGPASPSSNASDPSRQGGVGGQVTSPSRVASGDSLTLAHLTQKLDSPSGFKILFLSMRK